ncbi:MAG: DUF4190 domain-containing protein [Acidimicrobiales bacterium]
MQPTPPGPYPQPVIVAVRPTSGAATASMVLGIIGVLGGWCLLGIPCALAVILGHVAMNETKTGAKSGHGMAVAGLILGYVCVVPAVVLTLMVFAGGAIGFVTPTPTISP